MNAEPPRSALRGAVVPPERWSSREAGTSERRWLRGIPWAALGRVDVDALAQRYDRAVIVAAHPDDEALAVGAFVATLAAVGVEVSFVLVTAGEGSHSPTTGLTADVVRSVRRREFDDAVSALVGEARQSDAVSDGAAAAPASGDVMRRGAAEHVVADGTATAGCRVTRLGLPDGGVAAARETLADALTGVLDDVIGAGEAARTLVIAPSAFDGHIDHDTCGDVAEAVAARVGAACVTYPLWWWHWGDPTALDAAAWAECVTVAPSIDALRRKRAAVAVYASQTGTFARPAAEPAMLDGAVLAHFARLVEVLFDPHGALPRIAADVVETGAGRTPSASFDAMFDAGDDPWGVETRWYERRRRALIEAMLPDEHLGRVLDLGCSTGALTAVLSPRASNVVAVDGSARALAVARRRGLDTVTWLHRELPDVLGELGDGMVAGEPDGHAGSRSPGDVARFDTIVLSEIGYFLDGASLLETLAGIDALLAPGGIVVVANWMHPTRDIPLDGRLVDEQVTRVWPVIARYEDADVAIVVARPDGRVGDPAEEAATQDTAIDETSTEGRPA